MGHGVAVSSCNTATTHLLFGAGGDEAGASLILKAFGLGTVLGTVNADT